MGKKTEGPASIVRRRDLKPKPELSDAEFLRRAQAAATRAQNAAERARRIADAEAANRRAQPGQGAPRRGE